ncbi:membrane-bound lytic murein transglycosylase A [Rhodovulum bhavnagarense]|uniref:peptidoglycan lytic exotransglycosylase n=1 Tax=Rhodovulum bhavnagarense TaxID=992286 RepID=A0A4R2RCM2_9RHOB|nr:murein transglycosylase A [Rhodovulum bhavnagarense]TCP61140.1 membrane-bound lytic murein transglycosylase A [Rhodovulum bhavnagarense]
MIRALGAALCLVLGMSGPGARADVPVEILSFEELKGWAADDHGAALSVFQETCPDLDDPDWATICALASQQTAQTARQFFELFFRPVLIGGQEPALFTGYYEPELQGARTPDARFRYPIYRKPPEIGAGVRWHSRRDIEEQRLLEGRGLEIAWLEDPVDVFFLQVQGSGRIRLRDGHSIRVGYGGKNGHEYRSVGQELVRRGIYRPHQVSADVIRSWVRRNPQEGRELLHHNPSFVFFRIVDDVPEDRGPLGAMNRSITAMRTVAIDPGFTPLGAPVWIEKGGRAPLHRLMVAQDTGSAIKGPQRADIFYGTGAGAGRAAGTVRDGGRLMVLMPIDRALALAGAG